MSADQTLAQVAHNLEEIRLLAEELESRLIHLKAARDDYAAAVFAARDAGVRAPQYSGSAAHAVADSIAPRLITVGQTIQFVSGELCRASY